MVLAPTRTITCRVAASAAAAVHMHYEGQVVETPLGSFTDSSGLDGIAVLAPNQGLVEFFPAERQSLESLGAAASAAVAAGWRVGVLVATHRMGEAHRLLRGRPLHLQAWWHDGDRVCFGGPEVP